MALLTGRDVQLLNINTMKTKEALFILVLLVGFCFLSYKYGEMNAISREVNILTDTDETAKRYFETLGNPTTLQEHCNFIYVVYADKLECK